MSEPITDVAEAVAALGALPVPAGDVPEPLSLPWAHAMSDDDLHLFLGDLVSAAMGRWQSEPEVPDRTVLADIERVCAQWRTPGQGLRSDEPEPEPEPDGITRLTASSQALRESDPGRRAAWRMLADRGPEGEHYATVHHDYRLPHDLPETGGDR